MKKTLFSLLLVAVAAAFFFSAQTACKREPVFVGDVFVKDTTGTGGDTTVILPPPPPDSADFSGTPCDPDSAYFRNTVFPLINSSCAISGCHDVASAEEGVILTSYQYILTTGKIKVFKPTQSKFYTLLSDPDPDDRMPPAPAPAFTAAQKAIIKKWIEQGALDNGCNENYGTGCSTTDVTYSNFVAPLVANQCNGCHSQASTGGGVLLKTLADVKASVAKGEFYESIAWTNGVSAMPKNGSKLSDCFQQKVKAWIDAGMPQ